MFKIVNEDDTFTAKELAGKSLLKPGQEAYHWDLISEIKKLEAIAMASRLKPHQLLIVDMGAEQDEDNDLLDHDLREDYKLRWNDIKGDLR